MTGLPHQMTACRVNAFGPPSAICLEQVPVPKPGPGEVLVRVKAAGVGPWDGWIRSGRSALPQPLPLTLGSDLSGIVEIVGDGISDLGTGDAVFGVTNTQFTGAYAEFAVATAAKLARKPSELDFIDAASVPVIAVTAWQALFDEAKLTRGQSVLIHGAAGNVGAYAVQLAHKEGVKVIATCGTQDVPFAKALGAEQVIDYRTTDFTSVVERVDGVIDLVGGETQTRSFKVLKPGGALISAVSQPDQNLAAQTETRATFFLVDVTTARLEHLTELLRTRKLLANIGAVLPLASARIAHEMLEGARPRPRGKIVLQVAL
jgi:NADPH:quinone reductase-like Zn-dependent oxidoreductase